MTEHLITFSTAIKNPNTKDLFTVTSLVTMLQKLIELYGHVLEIHAVSEENRLFPEEPDLKKEGIEELSLKIANMDFSAFYGSCVGFHYRGDVRKIAQPLVVFFASFGDIFGGSCFSKVKRMVCALFGIRYTLDSELAAKKVFTEARERPVEFCKTFYGLSEMGFLHRDKFAISAESREPRIKANCVIQIPPEKAWIKNTQGAAFQVPIPSSHLGTDKNIQVRLISPFRTPEMVDPCPCIGTTWKSLCSCQIVPAADSILFHLHGGGFVSQTSLSHQRYLKRWSINLGIPILSVDYSLAPEAPFPRAAEEVLYAYCWMRNNFARLGTTGNRVIVVGDSAGGNLGAGLVLQCIQQSLPKPDHLIAMYPSLLCQMYPSPSRLICLMDPLVMFPCLLRCLNSYADQQYVSTCPRTFQQELDACQTYSDPLLSPLLAPQELLSYFIPTTLVTTDIDPCLDETIAFSNKLVDANVKVELDVLSGLPHGFLSLTGASKDCESAVDYIAAKMLDIVLR